MDIVLVIVYAAMTAFTFMGLQTAVKTQTLETVQLVIVACVIVFWIIDAVLVSCFKGVVESSVGNLNIVTLSRIIRWKRVVVVNSSLGLIMYAARLTLEVYMFVRDDLLSSSAPYILIFCFIFLLKVMRVLAFNSFSKWIRLTWSQQEPLVVSMP